MAQAVAKYRVSQIASSLIHIPDGISLSHGAMTQTKQLRKDEPHPVGPLVSISQLFDDLIIDLRLSVHEANEVSLSTDGAPNPQALGIKSRLSPAGVGQRYRRSAAATGVTAIEAFHERGIFRETTTRNACGG